MTKEYRPVPIGCGWHLGCALNAANHHLFCNRHIWMNRERLQKNLGINCEAVGCSNGNYCRGLCHRHYARYKKYGIVERACASRENPGRTKTPSGYIRLQWYEDKKAVQIFEHRWVMEREIGRPLLPEENVHHINGVRDDNRIDNLELWSKSQPPGQRVSDKIIWAKEILDLYGEDDTQWEKLNG